VYEVFFATATFGLEEEAVAGASLVELRRKSELRLARRRRVRLVVEFASSREATVMGETEDAAAAGLYSELVVMIEGVVVAMDAPGWIVDVVAAEAVVAVPESDPATASVPAAGVEEMVERFGFGCW
jgi:hypothetical protein